MNDRLSGFLMGVGCSGFLIMLSRIDPKISALIDGLFMVAFIITLMFGLLDWLVDYHKGRENDG